MAGPLPEKVPGGALLKRTVSVYSADPSPNLKPQLRQNRRSLGIGEWQCPQVVTNGSISGFIDISPSRAFHYGIALVATQKNDTNRLYAK